MLTRRDLALGAGGWAVSASLGWAAEPAAPFEGVWSGVLVSGSIRATLRLEIGPGPNATLRNTASDDAPQRAASVSIRGDNLVVRFPAVFASYHGRRVGDRIEGEWRQTFHRIPLVFLRGERPFALADTPPLTPALLAARRHRAETPGIGAAFLAGDTPPVVLVDGLRRFDRSDPVLSNDAWHLGSITKSMTATLAARAVEAGAITWTDTVGEVLGAAIPEMQSAYRSATLVHLMSHAAGLPANAPNAVLARLSVEPKDVRSERAQLLRSALTMAPVGRLGARGAYSNLGFVVAGAMLEARLGLSWEHLMHQRLFEPMRLTSAGFGPPRGAGTILGHREPMFTMRSGRPRVPVEANDPRSDNVSAMGPAGSVHMSLTDLMQYLRAHRDADERLLRKASWARLHAAAFDTTTALGWEIRDGRQLWHNGSNTLWYAEVLIDMDRGVCAAACANDGVEDETLPAVGELLLAARQAALS